MDSTTYTRAGITVLSDDGSDGVTAYRVSLRNLAAWANTYGALYGQGVLSARPAAGKAGRFYRATDDASGVVYYDDGSTWQSVGTSAAIDAAAGVGSLRTLGAGALQAAAGNHAHAIGVITGTGDSVTKNVGTASGTVAAGDHAHSVMAGVQTVIKASGTTKVTDSVFAADPDLHLTLATGTYRITALLSASGNSGADIQMGWGGTATYTTKIRGSLGPNNTTSNVANSTSVIMVAGAEGAVYGTDGSSASFIHEQLVIVVTGSGTIALLWAQSVATSTTTLNAGSTLIAEKIA